MNQESIIKYFNQHAKSWDACAKNNGLVINAILDNSEIASDLDVLDVACGTGVLIPFYLSRKVNTVCAVDISPEMVKIAQAKFLNNQNVEIICADADELDINKKFDRILVYNAFPHFKDGKHLIKSLSNLLKPGGILSVAHGMGREAINHHHKVCCSDAISVDLVSIEEMVDYFRPLFDVYFTISTDYMYQICGRLK